MNKAEFEEYLAGCIGDDALVSEAMNYSLLAGGKRFRPLLLLDLLEDFGVDQEKGLNASCAIEMIHTYSLIHDDLPAMDNDDYRRGRLTSHKKFDEATAILAGDALLTKAFEITAESDIEPEKIVKLEKLLADKAGYRGMINGQMLDMKYTDSENVTIDQLKETDYYKTGELITLPLLCGCIIADREDCLDMFDKIGHDIGIAFQIQDDVLDYTSNPEEMGKSTSDDVNNKNTYYTLLGEEEAIREYERLYYEALSLLDSYPDIWFSNITRIIREMKNRRK